MVAMAIMVAMVLVVMVIIRARWEWPESKISKNTWILMGNGILNLICFLHSFELSTPFAAKNAEFYKGKMPKIGPKSTKLKFNQNRAQKW